MSSTSPATGLSSAAHETATTGVGRVIEATARLATSSVGLATAYIGAVTAAVIAFQKLAEPLRSWPTWARAVLVSSVPILILVFHAIPMLVEQRRKKRLSEISGHLQASYFRLAPLEEEDSFTRADGKHEEILRWLAQPQSGILYLTGLSGSGKSSLLAASVLPNLKRQNTRIIRLRGYQDPLTALQEELQKPGVIWQKAPPEAADVFSLLDRARRYIRPSRLLVVLDQFEEFVILQDPGLQQQFTQLLSTLRDQPAGEITFLLVFRSDYIGLIEKLALPPLIQDTNWKEIPPFTESAARDFMRGSGLQVTDELLRDVLREAAELEETKGLIRPIIINLCGLVLSRFATSLPRGFRPGGLVRGFLRESILLPSVRDVAPHVIPHLISSYVTKRPRTVTELAQDTALDPAAVRGCLRVLGQRDRAIVRPLDGEQQTWEISHDFLVPLLDSIVARWTVSAWRRFRPWVPWAAAGALALATVIASNWRRDPIAELTELGWEAHRHRTDKVLELLFDGVPTTESTKALLRIHERLSVKLKVLNPEISKWSALSLSALDLSYTHVSDLSPLKDLTNLSTLKLGGMDLSDVALKDLPKNLSTLDLSHTHLSNVALKDLPKNLSTLNLGSADLSHVALNLPKNLSTLDLSHTHVIDLSPLKDLTNLSTLDLSHTRVSDLSPLEDLTNLSTRDLSHTRVSDVVLEDLPKNLSTLSLSGTHLSDVALKDLPKNLSTLDLSHTHVRDLSPLKILTKLSTLNLSGTDVSDVAPLKDLKKLSTLYITRTHVNDLSPLKNLKNPVIKR